MRSRADRACARLHALASYLEADPETAGVLAFLTPSFGAREFPSGDTLALIEQFAIDPPADLPTLVRMIVRAETNAALDTERAFL